MDFPLPLTQAQKDKDEEEVAEMSASDSEKELEDHLIRLNNMSQKDRQHGKPSFTITRVGGLDHQPVYSCCLRYRNLCVHSKGSSIKEAKHEAGRQWFSQFQKEKTKSYHRPTLRPRSCFSSPPRQRNPKPVATRSICTRNSSASSSSASTTVGTNKFRELVRSNSSGSNSSDTYENTIVIPENYLFLVDGDNMQKVVKWIGDNLPPFYWSQIVCFQVPSIPIKFSFQSSIPITVSDGADMALVIRAVQFLEKMEGSATVVLITKDKFGATFQLIGNCFYPSQIKTFANEEDIIQRFLKNDW